MRSLFAPRPSPYYIFGFNYRRSSAGIRVMHMLCDSLIRSGHEAYVWAEEFSPDLMTPKLTDEVVARHRAAGLEPIAIYPEVVDGNPLNGSVVVRYLLNKPGFIAGKGEYADTDVLFTYKNDFMVPGMPEENHLFLPAIDSNIFRPDPDRRIAGRVCYYLGHKRHAQIDSALLPADAIEITLTYPDSWEGLANIFQECEYLYLGEASGLGYEAALCGCQPILVTDRWSSISPDPGSFLAFSMEPDEISRARSILPSLRDSLEAHREAFWGELDYFIDVTQEAANSFKALKGNKLIDRWQQQRSLSVVEQRLVAERRQQIGNLSVSVIIYDPSAADSEQLRRTLESLAVWKGSNPQLAVAVVSSQPEPTDLPLSCKWQQMTTKSSHELNHLLKNLNDDWVLLLSPGDELLTTGTLMLELELTGVDHCSMVYADEICRDAEGDGIAFRPDFNLDYLLSFPGAMARHWLFRRERVIDIGGFDPHLKGAIELDLILRLIERDGTAGIGHIAEPLMICKAPQGNEWEEAQQILERHLLNRGYEEGTVTQFMPGRFRLSYGHAQKPRVTIIIPTRDQLTILRRCVMSLLETTTYPNYEVIIVDNDSRDSEAIEWLAELEAVGGERVRVLRYPHPFNYSAMNNLAVAAARGEYLVLLNNDTAVIQKDWIEAMLNHALRPEVGIVGAKLLFPNKTVQHGGVILGLTGPAEHPFIGEKMDAPGYMNRLLVDQNYTAVTAACMMIRKSIYQDVGGLDEGDFKVSYNDVDFCLKVHQTGYLTVWTPHAVLMHEGSVSQKQIEPNATGQKLKRFVAEQDAMYAKWLPLLARDPAYNPNFSLVQPGGFKLADSKLSWRPLSSWRPLPVVLAHPADQFGCGHYRVMQPFLAQQEAGLIGGAFSSGLLHVSDLERYDPDVIVLQRQIGDERLESMRRMKAFSRAFKVYELDDYLPNLPMKSAHRSEMPKDIVKSLRRGLGCVDRFIVSTQALAEAFSGFHNDIRVMQNHLPSTWWRGLQSQRRVSERPRVGWAGGVSHSGDLDLIADVVKELANEVDWIFFGMCPEKIRPFVKEVHVGVEISQYPTTLAGLNLDLAVAPLEQNLFNECKSNLRLLEYGACGFPVICSDVGSYRGNLPATRVKNRFRDWVDAIRMHLSDLDATAQLGDELRSVVLNDWMLEGRALEQWRSAWLPD